MKPTADATPLLQVQGLRVDYPTAHRTHFRAVDSVDFALGAGRTIGLVGESGSGKSTVAKSVLGIAPVTAGTILFDGQRLDPRRVRRRKPVTDMQVVFQDPVSSLDPTKKVAYTVAEPLVASLRRHGKPVVDSEVRKRVTEMLELVGLHSAAGEDYPGQFSGGQRQRIAIARALVVDPRLVICDEAVSALDLSIQAQILNLLADIRRSRGISYLFISHDLSVVEHISDSVVVLYRGRVMESGPTAAVHRQPAHPYTRTLLAASPVLDPVEQRRRRELRASYRIKSPRSAELGDRCPFEHRCPFAIPKCREQRPLPQPTDSGGTVACHRHGELPDFDSEMGSLRTPTATERP